MKLLIEIDENDYETIKNDGVQSHIALADEIIANGEPITDDMISREQVLNEIGQLSLAWEYGQGVSDCHSIVKNAPAYGKENEDKIVIDEFPESGV